MEETEAKPRRTRRRLGGLRAADPIAAAMQDEAASTAEDLADALAALSTVTGSDVKVVVFRVPATGSWEHVKQVEPPFNVNALIHELEQNYGPGKYAVRVFVGSVIKTTKHIAIAAPKIANNSVLGLGGSFGGPDSVLKLLLDRLDRKPDDGNKDLFALMMSQQQESAKQMATMQMESTKMMMGLMTALVSGKSNPMDDFGKTALLLQQLRGPEHSMKETFEMLAAAKELVGGGGESGGGFMGMAEKVLPAFAGMMAQAGQGQPQGGQPLALPAPATRAPPPAVPGAASSGPPAPAANDAATAGEPHPILSLVQPEIEFFMARGHDPELAADGIADILKANHVTREQLIAFGMEIQGTDGNFVGRLLALGLDVSQHTEWFTATLHSLAEIDWSADDDAGADSDMPDADREREGGSGTNPAPDAQPRTRREPANPRPKQGGATG